jgi:hypothetical protein
MGVARHGYAGYLPSGMSVFDKMVRLIPAGICAFASPTAVAANPATAQSAQAANFLRDNIDPSLSSDRKEV